MVVLQSTHPSFELLHPVHGVVVRKNVKTIEVRSNDGEREWKVTACMVARDDQA